MKNSVGFLGSIKDKMRMFHWVLISIALYVAAAILAATQSLPQVQVVLWKLGHITLAAFVGYWVDRHGARDRLTETSPPHAHLRRAIIIGAAMLAIAMGL
jgi:hypothetical protein